MASESTEDYLKAIYTLGEGRENVSTTAIATRLSVAPASVTKMIKRLADEGYLRHAPYQGVSLTERGERVALRTIRAHRLLELYLARMLGFPWDQVDAEAERLEHVVSEALEARIDAALGFPTSDPHGHSIPGPQGSIPEEILTPLSGISPGTRARIHRVSDANPDMLRYLGTLGMYPGVFLTVCDRAPFGGPIRIRLDDRECHISHDLAEQVFVAPLEEGE